MEINYRRGQGLYSQQNLRANSPSDKSANRCPALIRKIFRFRCCYNHLYRFARLAPRGAARDRHGRGAGPYRACERSSGTQTNDAGRGRRSRVVLTPRVIEKVFYAARIWVRKRSTSERSIVAWLLSCSAETKT